jgi:hypothetical protein
MFCAPGLIFGVTRASHPVFIFCAPGLIFGDTEGVGSRFHVLRSRTRFRRYRGRPVSFSYFALPDSFSAVPRASGTVFIFYVPGLIYGGTEGVQSCFHVFRSRACFRPCRVPRVPFSCFPRPDSFSAVPRASGPVFIFSAVPRASGLVFHVLRARTRFRRYRGRRVPFSRFALPDSFSTVPSASGRVFMFCAPGLVIVGTEGVRSSFHVLRARTHFRRYRGRRVPFSCFAFLDSFSAIMRASGPFFMFCAPGLIFGGTECVGSRFHVLLSRTHFWRYRGRRVPFSCFTRPDSFSAIPRATGPVFIFYAPGLVFGGTKGVWSHFLVLRSRTLFRRYRGRRVPFSYFARPYSFSAVLRASVLVFMFCAPGLIFGGIECVGSHFHVLRSLTDSFSAVPRVSHPVFMFFAPGLIFGDTEGVSSHFHVLRSRTSFRRYRGRPVLFSCFTLPDSFSAVPRASGLVFIFYAPRLIYGGTEGVRSRFHVFRSRTCF